MYLISALNDTLYISLKTKKLRVKKQTNPKTFKF